MRNLDSDSASTPSLGRRVWTEAQLLTTMLVRYRRRASWAFALFFSYVIKRYIYKRRFIIQDRNTIDGSLMKQLIAVQIQSALSRLYNMWHLQVTIVYSMILAWNKNALVQVIMGSGARLPVSAH